MMHHTMIVRSIRCVSRHLMDEGPNDPRHRLIARLQVRRQDDSEGHRPQRGAGAMRLDKA